MSKPLLVIGNKRYSSWSLRGYLAVKFACIDCDEKVIPLFVDSMHAEMADLAPDAARRVPFLKVDDHVVWDTMSIFEYANEVSKNGPLWPEDRFTRAEARSVAAEMHAGFFALREFVPMNLSRDDHDVALPADVQTDIDRIVQIWTNCREKYGAEGPYLFGKLSLADTAFAPVAIRFRSINLPLSDICEAYVNALYDLPDFAEWREAAAQEKWIIDQ